MSNRQNRFLSLAADESTSGTFGTLTYSAFSWIGSVRRSNQDSFGISFSDGGRLIGAVADGMGGHAGGDVASSTAISMLIDVDEPGSSRDLASDANSLVASISRRLREIQEESPQYTGMGTTLSAVTISGSTMTSVHIGDSRIYRFRNGKLLQLTKDHSWVQQQVDAGLLNAEDAIKHPRRNVITRVLDARRSEKADVDAYDLETGDRILICSDGVHGVIRDEVIAAGLSLESLERGVELITDEVRRSGANDNATAVLISIDG
ncbi:PP2C family protein-serine/threonine phosphatase [Candidatus Lucifugimonas marina]|uniref:SpoIIE family protein phosphatase n=1 Tax=Candidatus Lucifugimonas marina TaxID=3038979 RepID=A0AAJ5ZCB6_9CHLR|nr:SpoIIE family protein phosphatase [SAR202 cluster bacterium JH702]MDG0870718.1 SpoIIE family protein phosphatase [SAR202 cluster bacterium JH639]WFG34802.1 SpoIIE family protein phosphatase [SAR202 cluster bacterium JH545]WFG38742.1 SpoIIE family protein phosphatase [SAR202 cluster bacterium JH1073]